MMTLFLFSLFILSSCLDLQTPTQKNVEEEAYLEAISASPDAENTARLLFADPSTQYFLREMDDGSHLYSVPPNELFEMFWNEVSVAELVHSFGDGDSTTANCGFDLSVAIGMQSDIFYNQWQLQSLGYVPIDVVNNQFMEWSETNLFGYPPFQNLSQPDLKTSTDRPVYAALNMYRSSGGNPQCGSIAAIFSRDYISNHILAAPLDTGYFNGACSQGQSTGTFGNITMSVCSAWPEPRPLGNPPYLYHLLQPYLNFYNQSQQIVGMKYPNWNLARLIIRLLSRVTYESENPQIPQTSSALHLNFIENTLGYFEFNPVVVLPFSRSIKMMIAMFELLWGTTTGVQLREWCILRGWPLAWAHNPAMSYFRCGPSGNASGCIYPTNLTIGIDSVNVRILDPLVLSRVSAGHNITIPNTDLYDLLWKTTNATEVSHKRITITWSILVKQYFTSLAIEPLFYGACTSTTCIGVAVKNQTCVCPLPSS
jgi:hypothetical protein